MGAGNSFMALERSLYSRYYLCGIAYVDLKINDKGESISQGKWVRL